MIFLINSIPLIPILFSITIPFLLTSIFKNNIKKYFTNIFIILSFFLAITEIIRVSSLLITNSFDITTDMSLQLCFLYPIICLLAIITKKRCFYDYIASSSILFGIGAIIIYSYNGSFFNLSTINNYLFHSTIIGIGLMFQKINYKIPLKNILPILIIFFSQLLLSYLINHIIGPPTNYMFLSTIFEPSNNIYHTQTLNNFYTPIIFKYSIAYYLTELMNTLGSTIYTILIIMIMIINYFISLIPFNKTTQ